MTAWLFRVSRACARHGWFVAAGWIIVLLFLSGLNRVVTGAVPQSFELEGTDSAIAQDLLERAFPGASAEASPLVLQDPELDFDSRAGRRVARDVATAVEAVDVVVSVVTPQDRADLLSADGHTALVQVTVIESAAGEASAGQAVLDAARAAAGPSVQVELGGLLGQQLSRPDTRRSEAIGIAAAVLVLLLTLRRITAAVIPLLNAIVAVGIGLALVGLLGNIVFVPEVAPTLGTMLGLGVGIDYALFLVVRHRVLLRRGHDVPASVGRTVGTSGAGVVFAGSTLAAAVLGLALTGLSFLAWLGVAAAVVVVVAVLASITFVPALLGIVGRRVVPRGAQPDPHDVDDEHLDRTGWARLADAVTSRPWLFTIASSVVLLVLAAPTVTLSLGHTDASYLPQETTARAANDVMAEAFGPGRAAPLAVVARLYSVAEDPQAERSGDQAQDESGGGSGGDPRASDPRLVGLEEALRTTPGVVSVDDAVVSTDGGVAIVRVVPQWGSADPNTEALVRDLRDTVLPARTTGAAMSAHVGGVTAAITDLSTLIADRTLAFILSVVTLSFLLLMLAYRSLVIPLKAAIMNLLSIAAAYGVVTAVFQWGWGAQLIGLDGPVPIESYVPMMMFAVLFGLSMDYEVFLLTAFREQWERTGDMVVSVRRGLADTGRVVTAAALIMTVVFASFVLSDNVVVKMFGVGLSTAVIVDATVVRCLLVPAVMVLAARGTWWLPGWLDRLLPHMHVEGDPLALDAVAAGARPQHSRGLTLLHGGGVTLAGVLVGVGLSWALGSRVPGLPTGGATAVAVSAVLGGVLVLVPAVRVRARTPVLARAAGVVIGVLLGLTVVSVLDAIVPPLAPNRAVVVAWSLLAVSLVAALAAGRSLGLPIALGGVAVTVAVAVIPAPVSGATLVLVALVPALATMVISSGVRAGVAMVQGAAPGPPSGDPEPTEGPRPDDRRTADTVGAPQ